MHDAKGLCLRQPRCGLFSAANMHGELHPPNELVALTRIARVEATHLADFDSALGNTVRQRAEVFDVGTCVTVVSPQTG